MNRAIYVVIAAVILVVVLLSSVFVVNEKEKALVLQFGQIRQVIEEPGLAFKIPVIQEVVRYDDRILSLDTETIEVTPSDDRRLVVDAFARYRIADVVSFRQAVGVGGVQVAEDRLSSILNAKIREVLGAENVTSDTILSSDRRSLMNRIRDLAQAEASNLGLEVVDVRLKQTNLPSQNLDATFARMQAERDREAADEIARGNEAAQRVQALADRTVVETVSAAEREAQVTRGEADARANRIFAEAYGANPEFFDFYRSLQAYRQALQAGNSTMVLTPDSSFFDYLYSGNGTAATAPEVTEADRAAAQAALDAAEAEEARAEADAARAAAEAAATAATATTPEGGEVAPVPDAGAEASVPADPAGDETETAPASP